MKKENLIIDKSMEFAVRTVRLYKYLSEEQREWIMSKQLLRSGTSIGANAREAIYAQSRSDFIGKLSICLKEASETEYWLELLYRTEYMSKRQYESIQKDCGEIAKLLIAILKSSKG